MVKSLISYKYIIITLLVIVVCCFYYYIDPSMHRFIPKCPIKYLTSLDCPGCGFQRALHSTLHGNLYEAVRYNLFLIIAIPITSIWLINSIIMERITKQRNKMILLKVNKMLIFTYIICYFSWFIIRNFYI